MPALHLFLLFSAITSVTVFVEMCHFLPANAPAKFRVLVARCSAWSTTLLILINMLLRVCKFVHDSVVHGICFGLERLELRYLFGLLTLAMLTLNVEIIQAACSTMWTVVLCNLRGQDITSNVTDGSIQE